MGDTREQTNAILKSAGFVWRKHKNDEEDADRFDLPDEEWVLHDPSDNDAPVRVRAAMERGAARGNAQCAAWLQRNPAPPMVRVTHDELQAVAVNVRKTITETRQSEYDREIAWREGNLTGLVRVCDWIDITVPLPIPSHQENPQAWDAAWAHARIDRFDTGAYATGTTYFRFTTEQGDVIVEQYGTAQLFWLTPEHADAVYRATWARRTNGSSELHTIGYRALQVLTDAVEGFTTFGSDLSRWVYDTIGEQALVDAARAIAPIRITGTIPESAAGYFAKGSKVYRIAINFADFKGKDHTGYGEASCVRLGNRGNPLTDWVYVGDEANAVFPDARAIQEARHTADEIRGKSRW